MAHEQAVIFANLMMEQINNANHLNGYDKKYLQWKVKDMHEAFVSKKINSNFANKAKERLRNAKVSCKQIFASLRKHQESVESTLRSFTVYVPSFSTDAMPSLEALALLRHQPDKIQEQLKNLWLCIDRSAENAIGNMTLFHTDREVVLKKISGLNIQQSHFKFNSFKLKNTRRFTLVLLVTINRIYSQVWSVSAFDMA